MATKRSEYVVFTFVLSEQNGPTIRASVRYYVKMTTRKRTLAAASMRELPKHAGQPLKVY